MENGTIDFRGHTLLVGGNNSGKSTICEALDLLLGPERLFRRPIIDEHDFCRGRYLKEDGTPIEIRISAVLLDLPEDVLRHLFPRTRPWSEARGGFVDEQPDVEPAALDGPDVERALPIIFIGWYDRKNDDFVGDTFFLHPQEDVAEDDENYGVPGAGLQRFGRNWKLSCGFIYLRTLRTGRRALSLERGSLLDTILRLGDTGRESMWEDTVKRLRDFQPPIGAIPQLEQIRRQLRRRASRFVGIAEGDEATSFYASELTRDHLREVVRFFVQSRESGHSIPFHRLGTGAINTLVFALLTHIADLRGSGSVIFAMEEPEIALPPHAQRRITRYLLRRMSQAIVTSHSPYVIEAFDLDQILAVERADNQLRGTSVSAEGLRGSAVARNRRQLAEAILARGVVVVEGVAEAAMLMQASNTLEALMPDGHYDAFDLTGVTVFDADGETNVPRWGPFFSALGKRTFAFHDRPRNPWTEEQERALAAYDDDVQSPYNGLEELLVAEVDVAALRRFLLHAQTLPSWPGHIGRVGEHAGNDVLRETAQGVLQQRKGEGYAAILIEHCEHRNELPRTVVDVLERIHETLRLPPLKDDDAEGPVDDYGGEPEAPRDGTAPEEA